jgi:hypothetical protein
VKSGFLKYPGFSPQHYKIRSVSSVKETCFNKQKYGIVTNEVKTGTDPCYAFSPHYPHLANVFCSRVQFISLYGNLELN